ncbi:MAG: hypothetical protein KKA10_14755 [Euryarchaeota archaeon]|nr:hypothetical protein [Euryarchaeota archaeon]MCG2737833.1 hypothetical protein [Candidatus Methanoperedenaceae archaeon]
MQEREKIIQTLKNEGYYYETDDTSKNYGSSICTKEYVLSNINRLFGEKLKLIRYKYRGWDKHQDVYSFEKKA